MPSSKRPLENVDLLVVGAGPVGLLAALSAARAGLSVQVLDHVFRGYGQGYASLLHSSTLQLLEDGGIADRLRAVGRSVERLEVAVPNAEKSVLELAAPALAVSQATLEQVLADALRSQGVLVRAPYQAATVEQNETHVDVRVLRRELVTVGSPAHYSEWEPVDSVVVRARYVIGADGYESRVRSALGIDTVEVGRLETFAMFECVSGAEDAPVARLGFTGELANVTYPLAGQRSRWGFQIEEELDSVPDEGRLKRLLAERAPESAEDAVSVEWSTVIHFERRLTRRFGKGRVWLAGDAAHVTSPLGGQSMNVGMSEAYDLVARVIRSLRGVGRTGLEDYGVAREREWHKLLGVNVSYELLPHAPPWLAGYIRRIVPALPASGPALSELLERIGVRLT